jgi:hypothetical protein
MPEKNEIGDGAHKPFADRAQHFANVQQGIETLKRDNSAVADSVRAVTAQIMCKTCHGSGGWGCGPDATPCYTCGGAGKVALTASTALRPPSDPNCQICLDTGTAYGKRCDHPAAPEAEPTPADWKQAYLDQCRITDELTAKLEEGSDKTLLARIAELQANLATMNGRYVELQGARDAAAITVVVQGGQP